MELAALAGWIHQLDCDDHGITCLVPADLRVETGRENIWDDSSVVAFASLLKLIRDDDLLPLSGGCVYVSSILVIGPIWF